MTKMKTLSTQTVPSQPIQQKNNSYMLCIPMLKNSKQKCIFKFKVTFWLITLFWSPYLLHLVALMLIKNWNNLERAHMQLCSRGSVGKYKIIPKWFCLSKGYFYNQCSSCGEKKFYIISYWFVLITLSTELFLLLSLQYFILLSCFMTDYLLTGN